MANSYGPQTHKKKTGKNKEEREQAREAKEYLTNNTAWDDLKELYQKSAEQLTHNFASLISLFNTPGLIQFMNTHDFKETLILFKGIQKDFDKLSTILRDIYNDHKDYSGAVKDDEEFIKSIQVFEAYNGYTIQYDSLVTPTYTSILEKAQLALTLMQAAAKDLKEHHELTDVNIISDVDYKDAEPQDTPDQGKLDA